MRELSLNILDVAQNSVSAGATRIEIDVLENTGTHILTVRIADDGRGMDEQTVRRLPDPFFTTRTTRKVGMGIPLFKMAAEMTGGTFLIESEPGRGTTVTATFRTDSVDCTPLGDVESSICALATMNEQIDIVYTRAADGRKFVFSSAEIKAMLDGVPLNEPSVMTWLSEYLKENAAALGDPQPGE